MGPEENTLVVDSQHLNDWRLPTTEVVASPLVTLAEKIVSGRTALGISQAALASRLGVSQAAVNKVENGQTLKPRFLPKLSKVLGIPLNELDPDYPDEGSQVSNVRAVPDADSSPTGNVRDLVNDPRLLAIAASVGGEVPVYAAVEGGPGEIILDKDPLEWVPRPGPLTGVKDGYLIYVSGTSMVPEYRPGERAIVNPRLPAIPEQAYVFYSDNPDNDRATIKFLKRITADTWHVEQYNPPEELELDRSDWRRCDRIVGKYARS